jgi:hypothetical protein
MKGNATIRRRWINDGDNRKILQIVGAAVGIAKIVRGIDISVQIDAKERASKNYVRQNPVVDRRGISRTLNDGDAGPLVTRNRIRGGRVQPADNVSRSENLYARLIIGQVILHWRRCRSDYPR